MTSHGESQKPAPGSTQPPAPEPEPLAPMLPVDSPGMAVQIDPADELTEDEQYPWGRPAPRRIQLFVLGNAIAAITAALVLIILSTR